MSNKSTQFFLEKDPFFNKNTAFAYFDFNESGVSGKSILSGSAWSAQSLNLEIANPNNFWKYSGVGFLDKDFAKIRNLNSQNVAFLMTYEIESFTGQNNVFISSFGKTNSTYSGVNFGISPFGFPYIEYYDNIIGPITYCHNAKAPKTGIFYCEISPINYSVGCYSSINKSINKSTVQFGDVNNNYSNNYTLGSGINFENSKNLLKAKISDIFIYDLSVFNKSYYEQSFISGSVIDLQDQILTGLISGTTGIIDSEIIELVRCYVRQETTGSFVQLTDESTYFASHIELNDFNNEIYNEFLQGVSNNGISGFTPQTINVNVCQTLTGIRNFEFESGYVLEYTIINKLPIASNYKYITEYVDYIFLNNSIDNSDRLFILGSNLYDDNIGYSNAIFENNTNRLKPTLSNNLQNVSGYYYNGQLQIKEQSYNPIVSSGQIFYNPTRDYFTTGAYIYTNRISSELSTSNILIDSWPNQEYIVTGNISSGSNINNINFSNKLCFLNGQLLASGMDYQLPNKILRNIPSGYNIISTQNIANKNFKIKYVLNDSGRLFNVNSIAKNTSSVWLNGVRYTNNIDYIELEDEFLASSLFYIKNGGNILFEI